MTALAIGMDISNSVEGGHAMPTQTEMEAPSCNMRWSIQNGVKRFPADGESAQSVVHQPRRNVALASFIIGRIRAARIAILGGKTKPIGTGNGKADFLNNVVKSPTQQRTARFTGPMW